MATAMWPLGDGQKKIAKKHPDRFCTLMPVFVVFDLFRTFSAVFALFGLSVSDHFWASEERRDILRGGGVPLATECPWNRQDQDTFPGTSQQARAPFREVPKSEMPVDLGVVSPHLPGEIFRASPLCERASEIHWKFYSPRGESLVGCSLLLLLITYGY